MVATSGTAAEQYTHVLRGKQSRNRTLVYISSAWFRPTLSIWLWFLQAKWREVYHSSFAWATITVLYKTGLKLAKLPFKERILKPYNHIMITPDNIFKAGFVSRVKFSLVKCFAALRLNWLMLLRSVRPYNYCSRLCNHVCAVSYYVRFNKDWGCSCNYVWKNKLNLV